MVGPGGRYLERLFDDRTRQIGTRTEVSQTCGSLPNATPPNIMFFTSRYVIMLQCLIQLKLKIQFLQSNVVGACVLDFPNTK
jgi:hypothetical protein